MKFTTRTKYFKNQQKSRKKWITKFKYQQFILNLKAIESDYLSENHIEIIRRIITKQMDKLCRVYIKIKPWYPIIKKTQGTRMGKGKGKFKYFVYPVYIGHTIVLAAGIPKSLYKCILSDINKKLSIKTKLF